MSKKTDKDTEAKETQQEENNAETMAPQGAGDFPATINGHYIRDLSIENPYAPDSIRPGNSRPNINVDVSLDYRKLPYEGQDTTYEVILSNRVVAMRDEKPLFIVELQYGVMATLKTVPEEKIEPFLLTEIPRYAFPFVRQIVAEATAHAGFQPLYLAPINFNQLYMKRRAAVEQQQNNADKDDQESAA